MLPLLFELSESTEFEWECERAASEGRSRGREEKDGWRIVPFSGTVGVGGDTLGLFGVAESRRPGSSHMDLRRVAAVESVMDLSERAEDRTDDESSAGALARRIENRRPLGVCSGSPFDPSVATDEKLPLRSGLAGGLSGALTGLTLEKTPPRPRPNALRLRLPTLSAALTELARLRLASNELLSDSDEGGGLSMSSSSSSSRTDWMSGDLRREALAIGGDSRGESDGSTSVGIDWVLRRGGRPPGADEGPEEDDDPLVDANGEGPNGTGDRSTLGDC